jgi:hypothetical protein
MLIDEFRNAGDSLFIIYHSSFKNGINIVDITLFLYSPYQLALNLIIRLTQPTDCSQTRR